jgi:TonB family protein
MLINLFAAAVFFVFPSAPPAGTVGIPTILQQVRIGDVPLIHDTGMTPPIALAHPTPAYTVEALQQGLEGEVIVRAAFDIDGNFEVLEVIEGLGYGLDEAALAALSNWRFRPAYRNGRRVPVVANVVVEYRPPITNLKVSIDPDGSIRLSIGDMIIVSSRVAVGGYPLIGIDQLE